LQILLRTRQLSLVITAACPQVLLPATMSANWPWAAAAGTDANNNDSQQGGGVSRPAVTFSKTSKQVAEQQRKAAARAALSGDRRGRFIR
jgi:hypothetical protein